MNYDDQQNERRKLRAAPDEDAAELARLWFRYLQDQGVDEEHLDDPNVRYWRALDGRGD